MDGWMDGTVYGLNSHNPISEEYCLEGIQARY
jgi:hypothetical protein